MLNKLKVLLILFILFIPIYVDAYSDYIIASGENIGIKLKSKGIIVIGNYDDTNSKMKKGDSY